MWKIYRITQCQQDGGGAGEVGEAVGENKSDGKEKNNASVVFVNRYESQQLCLGLRNMTFPFALWQGSQVGSGFDSTDHGSLLVDSRFQWAVQKAGME